MDLKALMQKLETINTTQIVSESVETKQVITESVARRVVKESADPVFTSSIARGLVEEFGYELDEAPVTTGSGAPVTSGSGAPVQSGTAAPAADAAAAAKAKLSPAQLKWLGGADPTDPAIMARLKSAVPDAPGAAGGSAGTKPAAAPASAPGGVQAMGDDDGNTMITKPDGTVQVVGPDGKPLANGGRVDPTGGAGTKPAAADPAVAATREKFKALMDKLEKTGGVSGSAPAPAAPAPAAAPTTGAGTKKSTPPAAPAATPPVDPTTQSVSQRLASSPSFIDQARAKLGISAGGTSPGTRESVSFEDDQTLLAIKNIRY
jgi:hypothetical protein